MKMEIACNIIALHMARESNDDLYALMLRAGDSARNLQIFAELNCAISCIHAVLTTIYVSIFCVLVVATVVFVALGMWVAAILCFLGVPITGIFLFALGHLVVRGYKRRLGI